MDGVVGGAGDGTTSDCEGDASPEGACGEVGALDGGASLGDGAAAKLGSGEPSDSPESEAGVGEMVAGFGETDGEDGDTPIELETPRLSKTRSKRVRS